MNAHRQRIYSGGDERKRINNIVMDVSNVPLEILMIAHRNKFGLTKSALNLIDELTVFELKSEEAFLRLFSIYTELLSLTMENKLLIAIRRSNNLEESSKKITNLLNKALNNIVQLEFFVGGPYLVGEMRTSPLFDPELLRYIKKFLG